MKKAQARRWYQLHLGSKILLFLMVAGAAPLLYDAVGDLIYGTAWDWDTTPLLDVMAIGFIFTVITVVTAVTEWMLRRQYLRLHLSTAFVLMLLASGCVWLNIRPSIIQNSENGGWQVEGRGWPFGNRSVWCRELKDAQKAVEAPYGTWIANGLICLGLLLGVAFIIEWRIRIAERSIPKLEHKNDESGVGLSQRESI